MTSAGVSRFDVKKILNHADRDVTSVNDRSSYDQEKKRALMTWDRELKRILLHQPKCSIVEFQRA
jgi:hypothetical protein